jgi:hypothetical protein
MLFYNMREICLNERVGTSRRKAARSDRPRMECLQSPMYAWAGPAGSATDPTSPPGIAGKQLLRRPAPKPQTYVRISGKHIRKSA